MIPEPPPPIRPYINQFRRMREEEEELARANPFLAQALEDEKRGGHRLSVIARTIALTIVGCLLPFLFPHPSVLIYEFLILVFIGLGWLQLRLATVGYSRLELFLIFIDLALLTLICIVPNPFLLEPFPTAYLYRFDNFQYFFILLALGTLAYSWRTIWALGVEVAFLWILGVVAVWFFGHTVPELSEAIATAMPGYPIVSSELDPNSLRLPLRAQELVVFLLVAAILAVKGWRANQLLIRQALIAEERANLSRYFPASMVDSLASTDHDIGAVRSQEIAVLFSDIVGFTQIAESETPERVMALLRSYHEVVEKALFENGGTLDKYLGDGVMATFGTPEPGPDDAINALKAAKQILQQTAIASEARARAGEPTFKVSVGVHFGPAVMGDIGPDRRLEFAVVGDTVNVASRLEAATRELSCSIALSDDLIKRIRTTNGETDEVPSEFKLRKGVKLKGRTTPIDVWTNKIAG